MGLNEEILRNPKYLSSHLSKAITLEEKVPCLNSVGWLSLASVHSSILAELSQLSNQIQASNKPQHLKVLISCLLKNLTLPEIPVHSSDLVLLNQTFSSVSELKKAVSLILQSYLPGEVVLDNHKHFLLELFKFHPSAEEKLRDFQCISVGVHKEHSRETKCFTVQNQKGQTEISFVKAVNSFAQTKQLESEQQAMTNKYLVADKLVEMFVCISESNPILQEFCKQRIRDTFPHWRLEVASHKFFFRNILKVASQFSSFQEFIYAECLHKIIEVEAQGLTEKLDALLFTVLDHMTSQNTQSLFPVILELFKQLIVPTHNLQYVQHIIIPFCINQQEHTQVFLSALIHQVFSESQVEKTAAYIASFLTLYEAPLELSVKYLLYFVLKSLKKKPSQRNAIKVLNYLLFVMASKPVSTPKIHTKLKKALQHPLQPLKYVTLQEGLDYSRVLGENSLTNYGNLYLPFHTDLSPLKLCVSFFGQKRRRCRSLSFEAPNNPKDSKLKTESRNSFQNNTSNNN